MLTCLAVLEMRERRAATCWREATELDLVPNGRQGTRPTAVRR